MSKLFACLVEHKQKYVWQYTYTERIEIQNSFCGFSGSKITNIY